MKEKVDVELYVEERDNEGARDNGGGRKIRDCRTQKKFCKGYYGTPCQFFRGDK